MCYFKFFPLFLFIFFVQGLTIDKCKDRFSSSSFPFQFDNGDFYLDIRDKHGELLVDRFLPKEIYTITLKNYLIGTRFRNFQIKHSSQGEITKKESLGNILYKNPIVEDSDCPGIFKNGGRKSLSSIQLTWKAPEFPEKCIQFEALVVKDHNLVYGNHHKLQKVLCAKELYTFQNGNPVVIDGLKTPFKKCCACGTASYLVKFRGLWNKTTHPRDWPNEQGQLHWTDPIGATHNNDYTIYHLGGQASQAVSKVCSTGDSKVLKEELTSPDIRKYVKSLFTSGWMNGEDQLNEERSGYISVNKTHHLFSFISMMGPSPDWCTGVSGIDLCMEGCKWRANLTIPLYPWDAGIKTGETYKPEYSFNLDIPEPIKKIDNSWMKGSPFTQNRPVAEIIIQRVDPKKDSQCSQNPIEKVVEFHNMKVSQVNGRGKDRSISKYNILDDPLLSQMAKALCTFSPWTNWTPCSVKCGVGETSRKRELLKNLKNELCIQLPREETKDCEGRRRNCDFSQKCSLLHWSTWSECSATCKKPGFRFRSRRFAKEEENEECLKTKKYVLTEKESCSLKESDRKCDPIAICSDGRVIRCSTGIPRTRYFYHIKSGKCEPFNYYGCKGSLNNFDSVKSCEKTCHKVIQLLPKIKKAQLILLQSQTSYTDERHVSKPIIKIPDECFVNINIVHNCTKVSPNPIWYYNHRIGKCRSQLNFGCEGNLLNRFSTFSECMKTCKPDSHLDIDTLDKVDCEVSNWSHWGPCSTKCGKGKQFRQRSIRREPLNGGSHCPALVEMKNCFNELCY